MNEFIHHVGMWADACFGSAVVRDEKERLYRLLEETLELCQSLGVSRKDAHKLVTYVYSREAGDPEQELGDVMITLAAFSYGTDRDPTMCGYKKLADAWVEIDSIRQKHESKVVRGPLPGDSNG